MASIVGCSLCLKEFGFNRASKSRRLSDTDIAAFCASGTISPERRDELLALRVSSADDVRIHQSGPCRVTLNQSLSMVRVATNVVAAATALAEQMEASARAAVVAHAAAELASTQAAERQVSSFTQHISFSKTNLKQLLYNLLTVLYFHTHF